MKGSPVLNYNVKRIAFIFYDTFGAIITSGVAWNFSLRGYRGVTFAGAPSKIAKN